MSRRIGWISALVFAIACPSSIAQPTVSQQLVGRWEGQTKQINLGMRFSQNGQLVMIYGFPGSGVRSTSASPRTYYSIDPTPKPMHLDFKREKPTSERDRQTILTIFEFLSPNTLRLQTKNLEPGKPRPTKFDEPVEFSKVSDSSIVFPSAAQLTQAEQSKDGEGRLVMRSLALSSLYYSVEMQQFPSALNQLGLSNNSTQNYSYQLQTKSNGIALIARPKKATLKSYIAAVLRYPVRESDNTTTILCESVRPSRIAPPLPQVSQPVYEAEQIQCGSGSQSIDF